MPHERGARDTFGLKNFNPFTLKTSHLSDFQPDNADDKQWNVSFREGLHSAFITSNGNAEATKLVAVNRQLPVYQELVRALKAEAKAVKAVRQTQHFIYEMLDVSTLRILDVNPS